MTAITPMPTLAIDRLHSTTLRTWGAVHLHDSTLCAVLLPPTTPAPLSQPLTQCRTDWQKVAK